MREYKFRGRCVMTGDWVVGYLVKHRLGGVLIAAESFPNGLVLDFHRVDPDTVGQFTGACSDDDVKIFENDIVEAEGTVPGSELYFKGVVRFLEGSYVIDSGSDCRPLWQEGVKITILGDYCTNPELIGGEVE